MPLNIEKVGDGKFVALWTGVNGQVLKRIDTPVDESTLVNILTGAGCPAVDVYDALESRDPRLPSETIKEGKRRLDELIKQGNYRPKE